MTELQEYEVAVEFGWNFKYYTVQAESGAEAKQKVWDNILTEDEKNGVSSMEITDRRAIID